VKVPKSEHGRREVPLTFDLALALRSARGAVDLDFEALVFASRRGGPPNHTNVMRRYFKPAAEEAGAPWAGFHALRHTCASMLFGEGRNIRHVQKWLGHHAPSFTLDTYVHLLDEGVGEGLDLAAELGQQGGRYHQRRFAPSHA
jgi:integrase